MSVAFAHKPAKAATFLSFFMGIISLQRLQLSCPFFMGIIELARNCYPCLPISLQRLQLSCPFFMGKLGISKKLLPMFAH